MCLITADQRGSSRAGEQVRAARAALGQLDPGGYVHRFELTVGDEIQALLAEPTAVGAALSQLNSLKQWSIGIGIGAVDTVGQTSVSSAGPAFVAVREAVARARSKGMPMPIAVRVAEATPASAELAQHAQGLAQLLGAVSTFAGIPLVGARLGSTGRSGRADLRTRTGPTGWWLDRGAGAPGRYYRHLRRIPGGHRRGCCGLGAWVRTWWLTRRFESGG